MLIYVLFLEFILNELVASVAYSICFDWPFDKCQPPPSCTAYIRVPGDESSKLKYTRLIYGFFLIGFYLAILFHLNSIVAYNEQC